MEASIHRPRVVSPSETTRPLAIDHLNDAIQTIESFIREASWPIRLQNAWERARGSALERVPGARPDATEDIHTIKVQLEGLTKVVQGLADKPVTGKASYADILRNNIKDPKVSVDRTAPVPARRAREVIIAPGNEDVRQKQRSGFDIVRDINIELKDQSVIAARRLPSGDVMVTFEDQQKRDLWAKGPEIVRAFGSTARVKSRREYTVIAHGIRVAAVDPAKKDEAIRGIIAQNPKLRGRVEIVQLAWARKTIKLGKRVAPLHIGVATPEQANTLIEQGLLFDSELHDCEVFWGDCQVVQCFHCQSYKHTAKHCRNAVRCGFCAAIGHASKDCANQDNPEVYRCALCKGGKKHTAWAREYPIRRQQVEEAQRAYLSRPTRFQVRTTSTPS